MKNIDSSISFFIVICKTVISRKDNAVKRQQRIEMQYIDGIE